MSWCCRIYNQPVVGWSRHGTGTLTGPEQAPNRRLSGRIRQGTGGRTRSARLGAPGCKAWARIPFTAPERPAPGRRPGGGSSPARGEGKINGRAYKLSMRRHRCRERPARCADRHSETQEFAPETVGQFGERLRLRRRQGAPVVRAFDAIGDLAARRERRAEPASQGRSARPVPIPDPVEQRRGRVAAPDSGPCASL